MAKWTVIGMTENQDAMVEWFTAHTAQDAVKQALTPSDERAWCVEVVACLHGHQKDAVADFAQHAGIVTLDDYRYR